VKTVIDNDALYRAFCAAWDAEDPMSRGTREGFMSGFYSACLTYLPGEPVAVAKYDKCGGNAGVRWCAVPVADAPMLEDGEPLYRLSDLLTFTKRPLGLPQIEEAVLAAKSRGGLSDLWVSVRQTEFARAIEHAHGIGLPPKKSRGGVA